MKKETLSRVAIGTVGVIAGLGAGLAGIASAQSTGTSGLPANASSTRPAIHMGMRMMNDGTHFPGTIASISGSSFTLTGMNGSIYTVNAGSATVKDGPNGTASIASLTAGAKVVVEGSLSRSTITATEIHTGMGPGEGGFGRGRGPGGKGVMGQVTAVSGNTITVTGKDGKTYSVDAGSATIGKMVTISASDVKVGDTVGVEGSVNGTTVTATHIMDGVPPIGNQQNQNQSQNQ